MIADPHSLELISEIVHVLNGCIIGLGYDIADRPGSRVGALQARTFRRGAWPDAGNDDAGYLRRDGFLIVAGNDTDARRGDAPVPDEIDRNRESKWSIGASDGVG